MLFNASLQFLSDKATDALVIPFYQEGSETKLACSKDSCPVSFDHLLSTGDFSGKEGDCLIGYPASSTPFKRLVFIGLGKKEAITVESIRKAYGSVTRQLRKKKKCESIQVILPSKLSLDLSQVVEGVCEGILFALYQFDYYKTDIKKEENCSLSSVYLIGLEEKQAHLCHKLEKVHEALTLTRDLVNFNADEVTPQKLAQVAIELEALNPALKVKVLTKAEIEKNKMGLLLAVNKGSPRDPAIILLEYMGNPKSKEISAIAGKGITYDTGGLNLKPTGSMETMKADMAGAATVLGLIKVLCELKVPVNVVGGIATTENCIGSLSYKPGDVFKSYSGKTVEITNTDAEGRLVLADLVAYMQDQYPLSRMIDLATLTGAVIVAIGEEATGLFSNNDQMAQSLMASGEKTFERLWRLPLYAEYRDLLKSTIADIKNSGARKAGASQGAIFIKEFIKDNLPWAHLDIAGTSYLSDLKGWYHNTPATGVGIRMLLDYLTNLKE